MLHKAKNLNNYKLSARDGEIGKVKDFYFDDKYWTVRYIVADTGNWLTGRKVLISPYALTGVRQEQESLSVQLTTKQIEEGPSIDADKPVSRQYETDYYGYYGWPGYWYGPYAWGVYYYPSIPSGQALEQVSEENKWDPNLRSADEVRGYGINAADGDIGHVEDFLIDDETWTIRYLIIDTRDWLPGKKVLLSPKWIKDIVWTSMEISVDLNKGTIQQAPEYNDDTIITRDYENELHRYYDRDGYWIEEPAMKR